MDRRKFLKVVGMVAASTTVLSGTNTSGMNPDNVTLECGNKQWTVMSIDLPVVSVAEFIGDTSDCKIVRCQVVVPKGHEPKHIRLDASKEDFTIAFPDGTKWNSVESRNA